MKKILSLVLVLAMVLSCAAALADVQLGQVEYAAHGDKCFAVMTVAVDNGTIVAAKIEEFQFMSGAVGVPNSDGGFGTNYPEGMVLASKNVNNGLYSTNMTNHAGATLPLGVSYASIEAYVTGKTIAELEAEIEGKTKEEMIDAVASCTLADTLGYVQGLLAAAKAAGNQTGYYTLYNKTGESAVVTITENGTGASTVVAVMDPDAVQVVTYTVPADVEAHGALTFSFETASGYKAAFETLSIETAPITLLAADAMTGATPITFFAPAAE